MRLLIALASLALLLGCAGQTERPPALQAAARVETVTYPSGKDKVRGVLHRPAGDGPFPAVVVVHGDLGLTDWVKQQARRLAGKGYLTLAVDLYRGRVAADLMDAHILGRGVPDDRALGDLKAAVDYLAGRPDVRANRIGVIGWELGGGYALDAALQDPRLRAVVVCYGRLTTDPDKLKPLRASVLGLFAGKDEGITPETIDRFRAALRKAGQRDATVHVYPDCGHGFLDPASPLASGPAPAGAVADAWGRIDRFLAAELRD